MDDNPLRRPGNHLMSDAHLEELRVTTDVILQAAELVQELECSPPQESSRGYFINDSLDTDALRLPGVIRAMLDGTPEEVIATFDTTGDASRASFNFRLVFADATATISRTGAMGAEAPFDVELAAIDSNAYTMYETSAEEVSDFIASLLYPGNTPELARYTDPNDPLIAEEIEDVLRESVCDDCCGLTTYIAPDGSTEIIANDNGEKIVDIDIVCTLKDEMYFSAEQGRAVHDVRKLVAKMALDASEKSIVFIMQDSLTGADKEFVPDLADLEMIRELLQHNRQTPPEEVSLTELDED